MSEPILQAFEDMFDVLDTTLRAFKGQVEAPLLLLLLLLQPRYLFVQHKEALSVTIGDLSGRMGLMYAGAATRWRAHSVAGTRCTRRYTNWRPSLKACRSGVRYSSPPGNLSVYV